MLESNGGSSGAGLEKWEMPYRGVERNRIGTWRELLAHGVSVPRGERVSLRIYGKKQ